MVQKITSAGAILLAVAGLTLVQGQEAKKRGKIAIGELEKCDLEKGVIFVKLAKKPKEGEKEGEEAAPVEYQVTDKTQFVVNNGKGQKSTVYQTKQDFQKPGFKDKFKPGVLVAVWLDPDHKVARRVITNGRPKEKPKNNE